MNAGLCVGGPMHGQFVAQPMTAFSVAGHPEETSKHVHEFNDQDAYVRFREGTYWFKKLDLPCSDPPVPVWIFHGWSS